MSSNLDRVANVNISLDSPISNETNFDNILILGPAPKTPSPEVEGIEVGCFNSLSAITELGFVTTGEQPDPVGVAARVAFFQRPRPNKVYLAYYPEMSDIKEVLAAALAYGGWYCVCPVGLEKDKVVEVIKWTEDQNKICGYIDDDPTSPVVNTGDYLRSFAVFSKETEKQDAESVPNENKYGMAVAMATKAMCYHAGTETWALKALELVAPAQLGTAFVEKLAKANITYVMNVASKNVTMGGKTNGGEWIDVIRFRDWLQNDMQVRVVNLLVANPKIPYTDSGIGLVENQMLASLKDGQAYGGVAPTEYDASGAAIQGYVTSVPLAADLTNVQKSSRVLEGCKFSARLAGAIHLVEITGSLHYENLT